MGLVLGIGSGLFGLIVLWAVGLLLCVVLSRVAALRNGVLAMGVVIIAVSLILIFYPRESAESAKETSNQPVDNLSVVRTAVFVATCVFSFISLLLLLIFHWMEPQYAPALRARKKYAL